MYLLDQKYENKVYPCKPGFKEINVSRTCFPDGVGLSTRMSKMSKINIKT